MSGLWNWFYSKGEDTLLEILSSGPVPQHIGFVMDGNRRYARRNHKEVKQGHVDGYAALRGILEICMRLGVRCVSVYAFALDNFKRSPDEVDALMNLAETKLLELCEHGELLEKHGIRLNVIGKRSLLPLSVQTVVKKAEDLTKNNDKAVLNLCMPYGSQDEMVTSVQTSVREALTLNDPDFVITEEDIDRNLMMSLVNSPPLDILIRTSGVKRLSDYLLWECSENTQIQFLSCYWPDIGLWDLIPIILEYQRKVWCS
ncbi:dehydrodolichyl diphosphate synthetase [Abortiporus biennis]|nr:dehydrodolichyl diphosphate synthetase [Abortiporus biennis]